MKQQVQYVTEFSNLSIPDEVLIEQSEFSVKNFPIDDCT
jgi:hypothetical protein